VTWQPGTPIRTEWDWREWQEWRKESILVAQRKRRAKLRRIDYADVSPQAAAIIDGLRTSGTGGDLSSILNEIVVEWAAFRNKIALSRDGPKGPGPGPIEPAPGMTPKWIPVAATAR
jgi:hypothetical protein